jgi:hypothetical protein
VLTQPQLALPLCDGPDGLNADNLSLGNQATDAKPGKAAMPGKTKQTTHLIGGDHIKERYMKVCGCEISASEVRLAVVHPSDEGNIEMLRLKATRIELEDDTSEADLRSFLAALHEFSRDYEIDTFVIKTRAKKGRMAGGAVSFKIETLIQLVEGCSTRFVSPVALSNFAKKEVDKYPEKMPVYLKNAFLAGAYILTRG